jgi:hypothetical protein
MDESLFVGVCKSFDSRLRASDMAIGIPDERAVTAAACPKKQAQEILGLFV